MMFYPVKSHKLFLIFFIDIDFDIGFMHSYYDVDVNTSGGT